MYLKYVQIVNFRNHLHSKYEFAPGVNTIIGENDSGKSNGMTALRILLDGEFYYNTKRLKESDFSCELGDWRGHWIIISAFFDGINKEDQSDEVCATLIPQEENRNFLRSFIRCSDTNYGTITLYIRPNAKIRRELAAAASKEDFDNMRSEITLEDYEFYYSTRSQADFTNNTIYKSVVGDFEAGTYVSPNNDDKLLLGEKADIMSVWQHISSVFIDALRDVENELHKPKNPIKRIFDTLKTSIDDNDIEEIKDKIHDLNKAIASIKQIRNIGSALNDKLQEIVGLVYAPDLGIESKMQEDITSIAKNLMVVSTDVDSIGNLGLGHLNILYIALKLIEFEYVRHHEVLNIMIIEEPEAHVHTHIQRTLFDNLQLSKDYTQILLTTHSTHLSEVSDIDRMNILKIEGAHSVVMRPTNGLDLFGQDILGTTKKVSLSKCIERYLDAKRSVLLFSKGVVLVEGDGEEILVPTIIQKALGITLDEIGVGLINVGSVGFENVASLFSDERIKRKCALVTDLDTYLPGASKSSERAALLGSSRKKKLDEVYKDNEWVKAFYASYTFEVDFADIEENRQYIKSVIDYRYVQTKALADHIRQMNGTAIERYDQTITLAEGMGKGWYSTVLASFIDEKVIIPNYILSAVIHASHNVLTGSLIGKMITYALQWQVDCENKQQLLRQIEEADKNNINEIAAMFCELYPNTMVAQFIQRRG